jgi:catechol 2,3-dioxygenase-like lactoylglutathione lyase family enzyme
MKKISGKLGDVSAITLTTPDLEQSLSFYQLLGFSEVGRNTFPFPWIQISDGSLLITLRKDHSPLASLTYYCKNQEQVINELEEMSIVFEIKPGPADFVKNYIFKSPDGLVIRIVSYVPGFTQPTGPTAVNFAQEDFFNPEKYPNPSCGIFGEFAHPVKDLQTSVEFWGKLGFDCLSRYAMPYPWAIMSDGLSIVGLHQTNDFDYPVITYFAADQAQKIARLKEQGVIDYTEKGRGSITLNTPEKQHINLFAMGM